MKLLLVVILLLFIYFYTKEGFATKQEKANAISSWVKNTPEMTYENYKASIKKSDVVDYSNIKALGGLAAEPDHVLQVI